MIQEYLLRKSAEKDAIKAYNPKDIYKQIFSADTGKCWYVQFSTEGENDETAKQLSEVDEYVRKTFQVTILENGCSIYFDKRLFPLVSGFENKLRKLLYLTSAINHDEKSPGNITNLESQDFGQIFSLLFIDTSFMGKAKDEIKNLNRDVFTKANVIATIESLDENTLWDKLLGKDSVPTLRRRFTDVRKYRNAIMHFHHINWKIFKEIQSLYETINTELDEALQNIEIVESKAPSNPTFNQTLEGALRAQERFSAMADALKPSLEEICQLSKIYTQNPALREMMENVKKFSSACTVSSGMQRSLEQFSLLSNAYQLSPVVLSLQEQLKNITKQTGDISAALQGFHEIAQRTKVPKIEIPSKLYKEMGLDEGEDKTDPTDPSGNDSENGGKN